MRALAPPLLRFVYVVLFGFTNFFAKSSLPEYCYVIQDGNRRAQEEFRTGDYEEMMNKASCLSLLSNAVLVWNTMRIGELDTFRGSNQKSISQSYLNPIIRLGTAKLRERDALRTNLL
jgi:hypothetical protein